MTDTDLIALQTRLRILIAEGRSSWPVASTPRAPELTAPLRSAAGEAVAKGQLHEALELVEQAEKLDPADPRLPLQRGEILEQLRFPRQAALAYERAVELDPTPGLTYLQAGRAHKAASDEIRATYYVEQGIRRLSPGGSLHRRANFELLKLVFPVIEASGIAVGSSLGDSDRPEDSSRQEFSVSERRLGWWGQVSARWASLMDRIAVRWVDPQGRVVQEAPTKRLRRTRVAAFLDLDDDAPLGRWRVEALLENDVVHASSFELRH
jgi:tetratricopeptide (TPR) repeat protein